MNTDFNLTLPSEDADITFGAKVDEAYSQSDIFAEASSASIDNGIDVADWQAGFMLGGDGEEIVENVVSEMGAFLVDAQLAPAVEFGEGELLYVDDEESLVNSLVIEQSANSDYFDVEAFEQPSDGKSMSAFNAELEPFMVTSAGEPVDLDSIFDVMGLSGNRVTDENLYFEEPSFSKPDTLENNNPYGEEFAATPAASFSDIDFGNIIDQIADQMFISDES